MDYLVRIKIALSHARRLGMAIVYCEKRSVDWTNTPDFLFGLRPKAHDSIFSRSRDSCFVNDGFSALAEEHRNGGIILCGIGVEGAILNTYLDARDRNLFALVPFDLCGALPNQSHNIGALIHAVLMLRAHRAEIHSKEVLGTPLGS
ncbi:MAG: cysteine hydrolase [Neomegalonema sp.]|nr:cysteine hydrolase [Neomegalonema sp.]